MILKEILFACIMPLTVLITLGFLFYELLWVDRKEHKNETKKD